MFIGENVQAELEAAMKAEFKRLNQKDKGRPMTLTEMENLVTEFGQNFLKKMLGTVIEEQKIRTSSEKKSVQNAEEIGIQKDSVLGPS